MELRQVCDDFIQIGDIAILNKRTGNDVYDFDFRNHFECKSVVSEIDSPVLLHIGAVEDYEGLEEMIESMGMKLLIHNAEHLRCSTIEKWYPAIKDKTPFTKIYDELPDVDELLKDFSFPVFIKGNRQTNRHNKAQCIIENAKAYEQLKRIWKSDSILSWQKVAVRKYVKLQTIDDTSYPEMVPISYEFRFFCFEGKCVAYGPYWYMGNKYAMSPEDEKVAIELSEWAAHRVATCFIAVDLAKTDDGEWIIIEVNDAQESGFVGINPLPLWKNTMEAAQNRKWLSVDEMRATIKGISSTQELVEAYVLVHNKFWYIEDDLYDYAEGTDEYIEIKAVVDAWRDMMDTLSEQVMVTAKEEGLLAERQHNSGTIKQLGEFMKKYGYRDGRGWWVEIESLKNSRITMKE